MTLTPLRVETRLGFGTLFSFFVLTSIPAHYFIFYKPPPPPPPPNCSPISHEQALRILLAHPCHTGGKHVRRQHFYPLTDEVKAKCLDGTTRGHQVKIPVFWKTPDHILRTCFFWVGIFSHLGSGPQCLFFFNFMLLFFDEYIYAKTSPLCSLVMFFFRGLCAHLGSD